MSAQVGGVLWIRALRILMRVRPGGMQSCARIVSNTDRPVPEWPTQGSRS